MIKEKVRRYKRLLILQHVDELMEKEGFERLKMADVAAAAGISIGALYNLFPSKDALFFAYVEYQIDLFHDHLIQMFRTLQTPADRIRYFIEAKFKLFEQKKRLLHDTIAADPLFFAKLNVTKKNPAKKIYDLLAIEIAKLGVAEPLKHSYLLNGLTLGFLEYWLAGEGSLDAQETFEMFMRTLRKDRS